MSSSTADLKTRTKHFALRAILLSIALPDTVVAQVIGKQLLRSSIFVGARYREAHRARSNAEFVSKLEGGLQKLEETSYCLELLMESGVIAEGKLKDLYEEASHLTAIFVTCV